MQLIYLTHSFIQVNFTSLVVLLKGTLAAPSPSQIPFTVLHRGNTTCSFYTVSVLSNDGAVVLNRRLSASVLVCVCLGTFSASVPVPFWCLVIFSRVFSLRSLWLGSTACFSSLPVCMYVCLPLYRCHSLFLTETGRRYTTPSHHHHPHPQGVHAETYRQRLQSYSLDKISRILPWKHRRESLSVPYSLSLYISVCVTNRHRAEAALI